jgi:hypothetical protein
MEAKRRTHTGAARLDPFRGPIASTAKFRRLSLATRTNAPVIPEKISDLDLGCALSFKALKAKDDVEG